MRCRIYVLVRAIAITVWLGGTLTTHRFIDDFKSSLCEHLLDMLTEAETEP